MNSLEHSRPIKRGLSVTQIDSSNASEQIEVVSSSPMNRRSSWKNPELNTKRQRQTPHNKQESRTVPANHTEQGGVYAPHGQTQFRVLELCRQDCDSRLQCDANSKRRVQNTKENVERIDTRYLTSPHLWMFCICHHQ